MNRKLTKPEQGLIQPRRNRNDPEIEPDVILAFVKTDLEYILDSNPQAQIESYDQGFFCFHKMALKNRSGLILAGPLLGAPQAVMAMEKMIALGGRRFWTLGWCGSLQPQIKTGDFILPTWAVCEEGTSAHYPVVLSKPETDQELGGRLAHALRSASADYHQGPVWTTDAPYRETPSKIMTHQRGGILAVEMEMSAVVTLAHFREVKTAGLLVVSDELSGLKWKPGFHSTALKKGSQLACRILLQSILSENPYTAC